MLEEIKRRYYIDTEGVLRYKITIGRAKKDSIVGSINKDGYRRTSIFSKEVWVKDIVFYLHNGYWGNSVDHIDRVRNNDHPSNLREATKTQQNHNQTSKSKTSTYKGLDFPNGPSGRPRARIKNPNTGLRENLGTFNTEEEAARAYDAKAKEYFGEFAYLNFKETYVSSR